MSSTVSTLTFLSQNLIIYIGIPLVVLGLIGGCLTILVFLSLKTFRQNSCAFYLTIMSFTNLGQLLTGLLTRLVINITGSNWTSNSLFYCKFRWYCINVCALISFTCISLATIDQFFATSAKPHWHHYCNIRFSRSLCIFFIGIWLLCESPTLIFYHHSISPSTGFASCVATNSIYRKYVIYGLLLILTGILPIIITIIFGLLAYRHLGQISHRTVPLVRRELDKQLTVMVLVQVIFNFCLIAPNTVVNVYIQIAGFSSNPLIAAETQLISAIANCLYYSYFAVSILWIEHRIDISVSVSILYLYLCISTISSTIDLYIIEETCSTTMLNLLMLFIIIFTRRVTIEDHSRIISK